VQGWPGAIRGSASVADEAGPAAAIRARDALTVQTAQSTDMTQIECVCGLRVSFVTKFERMGSHGCASRQISLALTRASRVVFMVKDSKRVPLETDVIITATLHSPEPACHQCIRL